MTSAAESSRSTSLPNRSSVQLTLLLWLPMLGWYAALRPGIMSSDSLLVWRQATQGGWVDFHAPIYTVAVWVSATAVNDPQLVTLAQSLFLAASIVAVARSVRRLGAPVRALSIGTGALALSPMVGLFAVTLWKDIPYTSAVLFASARVIDLTSIRLRGDADEGHRTMRSLTLWLVAATLLRQNGVVFAGVVLAALVVLLKGRRRSVAVAGLVVVLSLLAAKIVVYPAFGIAQSPTQPSLATFLHDIAAVARTNPSVFEPNDRALLRLVAPFSTWRELSSRFGCSSANWQWSPILNWDAVEGRANDYLRLWAEVLGEQPRRVLSNRLCVGAIAWRPDTVGSVYTVSRGIDHNSFGLKTKPVVRGLDSVALSVLDATNKPSVQWLLWRGPTWIYAGWLALGWAALRRRQAAMLLAGVPTLALAISVFPFNTAQDARYMFAGVLLGALMIPLAARPQDRQNGGDHGCPPTQALIHQQDLAPPRGAAPPLRD